MEASIPFAEPPFAECVEIVQSGMLGSLCPSHTHTPFPLLFSHLTRVTLKHTLLHLVSLLTFCPRRASPSSPPSFQPAQPAGYQPATPLAFTRNRQEHASGRHGSTMHTPGSSDGVRSRDRRQVQKTFHCPPLSLVLQLIPHPGLLCFLHPSKPLLPCPELHLYFFNRPSPSDLSAASPGSPFGLGLTLTCVQHVRAAGDVRALGLGLTLSF